MKNLAIGLLAVAAVISFTQCNESASNELANAGERGQIISALMNNGAYMKQVMDSMEVKHGTGMGKHDMAMNPDMMGNMMEMCKTDSSMCKKMMSMCMDMCEADQSKCDMMMGAMHGHSKVMKSMEGMCDMKGMKMDKKK